MNIRIPDPLRQGASQMIDETTAEFIRQGFDIIPLKPRSKQPLMSEWTTRPTLSFEKLHDAYPNGGNLGVRTGEWSKVGGGFLHVIDLDIRNADYKDEAHAHLAEILPEWQTFPTVASGSGGESRHIYLITDRPFSKTVLARSAGKTLCADGKERSNWQIEFLGTGTQAVLPPSLHEITGRPYKWLRPFNFDMLELGLGPRVASSRLEALFRQPTQDHPSIVERVEPIDISEAEIREILNYLPADEWCEPYENWLKVGMALHHQFAGSNKGFDFWCQFSKQSSKYKEIAQKAKWRSFKKQTNLTTMATLLEATKDARIEARFQDVDACGVPNSLTDVSGQFADLLGDQTDVPFDSAAQPIRSQTRGIPEYVRQLNGRHAVAVINGKTAILTENQDGSVSYGTATDLHTFYDNVRIAREKTTEPVSRAWMRHPHRRQYPYGVVFAPGRDIQGSYNHWRGFAVKPDPKASCKLFLSHLREIVCCGDETSYRYLVGWLAHMIQKPGEKPGVAVVIQGRKGTGKDTVGDYVGGLFPHHHVKIAHQDHLTGRFNSHQERCLLLHVEEGFWAGSKQAEGTLKNLITSEKVTIEPKGLNAFQVDSVLRLFISSNESWVVPATGDERRFCVLNISDRKMQDKAYFSALRHERDNGGMSALLDYLQNYDLAGFDVRNPPMTEGLRDQKLASLKNIELWWYETLCSGELPGHLHGAAFDDEPEQAWEIEPQRVPRARLRMAYKEWMREQRFGGESLNEAQFGRRLKELCPAINNVQEREGSQRTRMYVVPPLSECRKEMESFMRTRIDWNGG